MSRVIQPESLALWFMRLNGFFTIPNFVVHPEGPSDDGRYYQQTDVDVLGVRFPYRRENRERPMSDFRLFEHQRRVFFCVGEVKTAQCKLNGPWTKPAQQNMQKVLSASGLRPEAKLHDIGQALYEHGVWEDDSLVVCLVCFGGAKNGELEKNRPRVPQLLWSDDVLPFIWERFTRYRVEKAAHPQWDRVGKLLFSLADQHSTDLLGFIEAVRLSQGKQRGG